VRIEVMPHVSPLAIAIVATLVAAALAAALVAAWPSALVLAAVSLVAAGRLAWESGVATAWLVRDAVPSAPATATAGSALVANQA
jgi:hypothetical protein